MKLKIYYFSGTGNSLHITKTIGKAFDDFEKISISKSMRFNETVNIEGDVIGFVFPVHFARPPIIVKRFIDHVDSIKANYIFVISNGGGLYGSILKTFNNYLSEKAVSLNTGFHMQMPSNHPKVAKLQRKSNEKILAEADIRLEEIIEIIKAQKTLPLKIHPPLIGSAISNHVFKRLYERSKKGDLDKEFWLNDSCNQCGVCITCCPVSNIELQDNHIIWNHHCVNCSACYHFCPRQAIELGNDAMERYHHPSITLNEFLESR